MDIINLTFKYTQNEYVKAERRYLFASKTITKISVIVLAAYFPSAAICLFLSSFSLWGIIACAMAIIAGIMGCILYFYIPLYKFKHTAKYQEEYSLVFSADGIKFKTSTIDSELKWSVYSEAWECDDFYFLIQAPRMYTLIPKRAFCEVSEKNAFEKLVISNMKLLII